MKSLKSAAILVAIPVALSLVALPSQTGPAHAATTSEGCLPASLKQKLAALRRTFGSIQVVSTGRPGATIDGSGKASFHADCRAVDFVPPSGRYRDVIHWLHANHDGGVGTYTCMAHIHIDNGPSMHWSKCR